MRLTILFLFVCQDLLSVLRRPAGAPRKRKDEWAIMDNSDVSNFEEVVPEMALEVRHILPPSAIVPTMC
jgi:hypothetical protein